MKQAENKAKARELFIKNSLDVAAIAATMGVSASSVYGWRRTDADTPLDWDRSRAIYNLSPRDLVANYAQQVRELALSLAQEPQKMADPKIADALTKHVSNLQKLNPKNQYMGVFLDIIEQIDSYLATHDSKLRERINRHWPGIREHVRQLLEQDIPGV